MFHICSLQQITQLELLCQQFYESMDINVRSEAEKALVNFSDSPESLPQCQIILERSQVHMVHCERAAAPNGCCVMWFSTCFCPPQSPYALLLASSTLTKLVTRSTTSLTVQDRLQLSELQGDKGGREEVCRMVQNCPFFL